MRALLILLVLLAGLGAWLLLGDTASPTEPPGERRGASPEAPAEDTTAAPAVEDAARAANTERAAIPAAATAVPGRCVVHGRVVDGSGRPLEGALVQLYAKRSWARGSDAKPLTGDAPGAMTLPDHVGYEVRTDAAGRFQLPVAPPSARRTQMHVALSPFYSVAAERFIRGKEGELAEGVRDLGDVVLTASGGLRGAVLSQAGKGLGDVQLTLFRGTGERPTSALATDATGAFEHAHLEPGTYRIRAESGDRVTQELTGVAVDAGQWSAPVEIRLALGPEVSGRVVDDAGSALAGAKVVARDPDAGPRVSVRSKSDGTFSMRLPAEGPVTVVATLAEHEDARQGPMDAPAKGLELVLDRRSRARVRVVDAGTGEPIERFGVAVAPGAGSRARHPHFARRTSPKEAEHPGGVAEVAGSIGLDLVLITAPGFVPAVADLGGTQWPGVDRLPAKGNWRPYAPGDDPSEQVVRLSPGARVSGTLAGDGWESARLALTQVDERQLRFVFLQNARRDAECTEAEPAFAFTGLAPGSWRLSVMGGNGEAALVPVLDLVAGESRDLGAVSLDPSGTITGTVLLPPGASVPAVQLVVADVPGTGADGSPLAATADADGRFRIEGVPPGRRTVRNQTLHADLMWGGEVDAVVPPGGEVDVTLDLTRRGLVPIEVTVELDGAPFDGAEVRAIREGAWPTRTAYDRYEDNEIYLGRTQRGGFTSGRGRALGRVRPVIEIDGWKVFAPEDSTVELVGPATVQIPVRLRSGEALLVLPQSVALPENGSLRFRMERVDDPRVASWLTVQFERGAPVRHRGLEPDAELRRWRVPRLPTGEWRISADVFETGVPERVRGAQDTAQKTETSPSPSAHCVGVGTISPGEALELRLEAE